MPLTEANRLRKSFDADCYALAAGNLPDDASEEQKQELAQILQDALDAYLGGLQG